MWHSPIKRANRVENAMMILVDSQRRWLVDRHKKGNIVTTRSARRVIRNSSSLSRRDSQNRGKCAVERQKVERRDRVWLVSAPRETLLRSEPPSWAVAYHVGVQALRARQQQYAPSSALAALSETRRVVSTLHCWCLSLLFAITLSFSLFFIFLRFFSLLLFSILPHSVSTSIFQWW